MGAKLFQVLNFTKFMYSVFGWVLGGWTCRVSGCLSLKDLVAIEALTISLTIF